VKYDNVPILDEFAGLPRWERLLVIGRRLARAGDIDGAVEAWKESAKTPDEIAEWLNKNAGSDNG
jgi:hypothetical protein